MNPIPLVLPLKANEAAALADLVYQQLEGKPLTAELRDQFARSILKLALQTFTPLAASLARDPVNASTYYIAVDTPSQTVLLHIALASSPGNELPGAVLIGRMRPGGGREIVMEALPFPASDRETVRTGGQQAVRHAISCLLGKSI